MKNKKYIFGLFPVIMVILGGIFKIMHWPGANILLVLGITSLCFIFLPIALWSSYKDGGRKKKAFYLVVFFTVFLDFIGGMFKIMHWPGAGIMMIIGITFPILVFLPVYLYFHKRDTNQSEHGFLYVMFLLVYLSVMSSLLALNVSKDFINETIKTEAISNLHQYHQIKQQQIADTSDSLEMILKKQTAALLIEINDIKKQIVLFENNENQRAIKEKGIDLWLLNNKDSKHTAEMALEQNGYTEELQKALSAYTTLLEDIERKNDVSLSVLHPVTYTTRNNTTFDLNVLQWNQYHYRNMPIVLVLNNLTQLQNNIIMAEQEATQPQTIQAVL